MRSRSNQAGAETTREKAQDLANAAGEEIEMSRQGAALSMQVKGKRPIADLVNPLGEIEGVVRVSSKTTHIVEGVVVQKGSQQRLETVHGTVRKEEVEITGPHEGAADPVHVHSGG